MENENNPVNKNENDDQFESTDPSTNVSREFEPVAVHVGELRHDVTESNLIEKFSQAGKIISATIVRDQITKQGLGYAFVYYQTMEEALTAMKTLNDECIKGRPCHVTLNNKDSKVRRSGIGNIIIKNLDKAIDNRSLCETFSKFGTVVSSKIERDENGGSRGFGFVHFKFEEHAQQAIDKVNGMVICDKTVFVGPFKTKKEREEEFAESRKKFTNIYIKNLNADINDDMLREMFAKFGNVRSAKVMLDETGKSRKFGFVNFEETADAAAAVEGLNDSEEGYYDEPTFQIGQGFTPMPATERQRLFVGPAQTKSERQSMLASNFEKKRQTLFNRSQGTNLFIKNLPDEWTEEHLRRMFVEYGQITSAVVVVDDNGKSKGSGFVCYSRPEEASRAVVRMGSRIVCGKPLIVNLAQTKEQRRAHLEEVRFTRKSQQ